MSNEKCLNCRKTLDVINQFSNEICITCADDNTLQAINLADAIKSNNLYNSHYRNIDTSHLSNPKRQIETEITFRQIEEALLSVVSGTIEFLIHPNPIVRNIAKRKIYFQTMEKKRSKK